MNAQLLKLNDTNNFNKIDNEYIKDLSFLSNLKIQYIPLNLFPLKPV